MLPTGDSIRPSTSLEEAKQLLEEFYGLEASEIQEFDCYSDRTFYVKVESKREQLNDSDVGYREYILKVLNSLDSLEDHVDAENDVRELLQRHGFVCPSTVRNLSNELKSTITANHLLANGNISTRQHVVRLLTFIPGEVFGDVPRSTHLFKSVGRHLADIQRVIKSFKHLALESYQTIWSLENVSKVKDFIHHVPDAVRRQQAEQVIQDFEVNVMPFVYNVERGCIHGDFNDRNIIVEKVQDPSAKDGGLYEIKGIIDFGDLSNSCLIFDLACSMTYMIIENKGACSDSIDVGGHVLGGYLSRQKISQLELNMLPYCVMARCVQSLVLGAYNYYLDPGNEYLLNTSREGWKQLNLLMKLGAEETLKKWLHVANVN